MGRRARLTIIVVALSVVTVALVFLSAALRNGWWLVAGVGVGALALLAGLAMLEEVDGE